MPKLSIIGKIITFYKGKKIPPGYTLIEHDEKYDPKVEKYAAAINQREIAKNKNYHSLITFEINYDARTLDQNALMWALYEIEANEQNVDMVGSKSQMVEPMELYNADVEAWGSKEYIQCPKSAVQYYLSNYRFVEILAPNGRWFDARSAAISIYINSLQSTEMVSMICIRGTSQYNTVEMARHIDGIFNRLASSGLEVTEPEHIESYWREWKQFINDSKILLHDRLMTQSEYRDAVQMCECCGCPLGYGTENYQGHIHHIKAIGMGADRRKEEKRTTTLNWLHLCPVCHNIWHQKGEKVFLEKAPYLKYKCGKAKRMEVEK